jgi:two-component system sensor histidine kinase TctE
MRLRESLRLRLLFFLLLPSAALIAVNAYFANHSARQAADTAYDRTLAASLYAIAERVTVRNDGIDVDVPSAALEMFESQDQDRVFYRVRTASGLVLNGYADLPEAPPGSGIRYWESIYRDEPTRFAVYELPLYVAPEKSVTITVGETTSSRDALAREIFYDALLRQTLLVVFGVGVIWFGVRLALRPLARLRQEVAQRSDAELKPLALDRVYTEVRPLVEALNEHMQRLEALIQSRQRFIANASHQLRTPLTLLNTQAEFALRQGDIDSMREVIEGVRQTTQKTVRLANQLLTISRAELDTVARTDKRPCDLRALAREVTLEFAPAARKKQIDIGFEAGDQHAWVTGNATLLHELACNLIDNAIRYSPAGGAVTVAVTAARARVELSVSDGGPGIAPEEHENVFKRFYSIPGQAGAGSGLGLAIVRDIAEGHDATIKLETPAGGCGLKVTVSFLTPTTLESDTVRTAGTSA